MEKWEKERKNWKEEWERENEQAWERELWDEGLDELTDAKAYWLREFIWEEYVKVPKEERAEWERETFQNRLLPIWFAQRKMRSEKN